MPDIALQRLHTQGISSSPFSTPEAVVAWLGAVQAQDYLGGLWAVGLRLSQASEAVVEQALAERRIVRTWPMRGTLHFVAANDVRWLLELLPPRVIAGRARVLQQNYGLDDGTFGRSRDVLIRALEGGQSLARPALYQLLQAAGVNVDGGAGLQILWQLAQEGLICFGPRQGKQQTFVLLDEWLPAGKKLERSAALAELAHRYFRSHGPAMLPDFAWWSGLAVTDARAGLEMAKPELDCHIIDGRTYWFSATDDPSPYIAVPSVYLLPPFDEYTVAYKDRSAALEPEYASHAGAWSTILKPVVVANGRVIGTWKRTLSRESLAITPSRLRPFTAAEARGFNAAAQRYAAFLGLSLAAYS